MLYPETMIKLRVIFLARDLESLTEGLGDAGVVHLVNTVRKEDAQLLENLDVSEQLRKMRTLLGRVKTLCERLGVEDLPGYDLSAISLEDPQIERRLDQIETELRNEEKSIDELLKLSGTLSQELHQLGHYPFRNIPMGELRNMQHLTMWFGKVRLSRFPELVHALADRALVLREPADQPEVQVLVAGSRRSRWAIEGELSKFGFAIEELPDSDESIAEREEKLNANLEEARVALQNHRHRILELKQTCQKFLLTLKQGLEARIAVLEAQTTFGRHGTICALSGWLPESQREAVENRIRQLTRGTAVVEFIRPAEDPAIREGREKVPVKLKESSWLSPFRSLILMFGPPRYEEVEPSLFVALSFITMFGLMFGDIGQGAVLAGAGLFCLGHGRKKHSAKWGEAGYWLLFCGCSAVVFGLLFGSFFGFEYHEPHHPTPVFLAWLPHPLLRPLNEPMKLFGLCLGVGVFFIGVSLVINIWNRFRRKEYFEGILAQFGLAGTFFYLGSIGLGIRSILLGAPALWEVLVLVGLPLLLLFLREPLHHWFQQFHGRHQGHQQEDLISLVMTGLIELLETINGFLGSTVSFARLGGFALSHAALCLAVYELADIVGSMPGGGLWSFLMIVAGNIFIILLEGMVVTIQGIRLEYYELFSKYYPGDGLLYRPFTIKSHRQIDQEESQPDSSRSISQTQKS